MFSTRSAYEIQLSLQPAPALPWHKVWSLPCPSKIKVFLWRALQGSLPTVSFLYRRHVPSHSGCFRCSYEEESLVHALRDCPLSKGVWLSLNPSLVNGDFFTLAEHDWMLRNCVRKQRVADLDWSIIFLYGVWFIWYWRNCSLHDGEFTWTSNSSQHILARAKEAWDVLSSIAPKLKYEMLISWNRPISPFIKVNVDESAIGNPGLSAAGGLLRDA